jgi:hypothetical protein
LNPLFELDAPGIEDRLRRKPSLIEAFAILFPIALTLGFVYLNSSAQMEYAPDYEIFMRATRGIFVEFYYTYWSLPIFQGLALLPGHTGFILWGVLNVLGVWFAARVFGGSVPLALLSYQMLFVCFYGQVTGVTVAGLALLWWGLERKRWLLAGIGAALALIKWQMGIPLCVALMLLSDASWYDRLRVMLVVLAITLASLIVYPNWIAAVIARVMSQPPNRFGDISIWVYLGAASLLLWLPPLLLPMSRGRRYAAICVAGALAVPYFQQTGLLTLWVLPLGWLPLLGELPFIYFWARSSRLEFVIVVPVLAYAWILWSPLWEWLRERRVRAATA